MPSEPAPYTPGFGLSPPILAGRSEIMDQTLAALRAGPRHPQFVSALIGHRGVGKTSLLDAIGERVTTELGWPVLHRQAMRDVDLLTDIADGLPAALGRWSRLGRDYRQLEKQLTVSVNLGVVSAEATVSSEPGSGESGSAAFRKLLHHVGVFAATHDTGALVTIDEASTARVADLAALAGAVQIEVNRAGLPIAVLFAGLPSFRDLIALAGTFAERLNVRSIEDLNADESRLALVEPAAGLRVRWEPAALDVVIAESGGHPYYVQLFGYHTWLAAGTGDDLTAVHAAAGVRAGLAVLHGQFGVTWARLRPQEQAFLAAAARIGGERAVPVAVVARMLGRTTAQLDVARNRLVYRHGLLRSPRRGEVQYRSGHLAGWVRDVHPPAENAAPEPGRDTARAAGTTMRPRRGPPGRGFER